MSTSKAPETTGQRTIAGKRISIRSASEEDYAKRQNWNVGTFHRGSQSAQPQDENPSETPKTFNEEAGSALEESMVRLLNDRKGE